LQAEMTGLRAKLEASAAAEQAAATLQQEREEQLKEVMERDYASRETELRTSLEQELRQTIKQLKTEADSKLRQERETFSIELADLKDTFERERNTLRHDLEQLQLERNEEAGVVLKYKKLQEEYAKLQTEFNEWIQLVEKD
ncbi:MAG: hypothetical protein K0Q59_4294, partial [Paenibacillus sp.]|nr:hypothetical protein [Paenibacillus sp.]